MSYERAPLCSEELPSSAWEPNAIAAGASREGGAWSSPPTPNAAEEAYQRGLRDGARAERATHVHSAVSPRDGRYQHSESFWVRLRKRVALLVGLLVFQSFSSFILSTYEPLLQKHTVVVFFLTMLVGAGGNAGNQSAVLVIRGLATGDISARSQCHYVLGECRMALAIATIMVAAGFVRVTAFGYSRLDAIAISTSLCAIVTSSVVVGALLPLLLHRMQVDPAHAGATIQVIMDLAGVLITCVVCSALLRDESVDAPVIK